MSRCCSAAKILDKLLACKILVSRRLSLGQKYLVDYQLFDGLIHVLSSGCGRDHFNFALQKTVDFWGTRRPFNRLFIRNDR